MEEITGNPYKKEDKKTLSEVIISQIDIIRKELSKEPRPSFSKQEVMDGKIITVSVPDQRKVNARSVETLNGLLRFYFDDKVKEGLEEISRSRSNAYKKFFNIYLERETEEYYKEQAKNSEIITNSSQTGHRILKQLTNYYDDLVRKEFVELVLLFKRKNELSGKRTVGYQ